jgi:hypothetical protein
LVFGSLSEAPRRNRRFGSGARLLAAWESAKIEQLVSL